MKGKRDNGRRQNEAPTQFQFEETENFQTKRFAESGVRETKRTGRRKETSLCCERIASAGEGRGETMKRKRNSGSRQGLVVDESIESEEKYAQRLQESIRRRRLQLIVWSSCATTAPMAGNARTSSSSSPSEEEEDEAWNRARLLDRIIAFVECRQHKLRGGIVFCSTHDEALTVGRELEHAATKREREKKEDDAGTMTRRLVTIAVLDTNDSGADDVKKRWREERRIDILVVSRQADAHALGPLASFAIHWAMPHTMIQYMQDIESCVKDNGRCLLLYNSKRRLREDREKFANVIRYCEESALCRMACICSMFNKKKNRDRLCAQCDVCSPGPQRDAIMSIEGHEVSKCVKVLLSTLDKAKAKYKTMTCDDLIRASQVKLPNYVPYVLERVVMKMTYDKLLLIEEDAAGERNAAVPLVYLRRRDPDSSGCAPFDDGYDEPLTYLDDFDLNDSWCAICEKSVCDDATDDNSLILCGCARCGASYHKSCLLRASYGVRYLAAADASDEWTTGCPRCDRARDRLASADDADGRGSTEREPIQNPARERVELFKNQQQSTPPESTETVVARTSDDNVNIDCATSGLSLEIANGAPLVLSPMPARDATAIANLAAHAPDENEEEVDEPPVMEEDTLNNCGTLAKDLVTIGGEKEVSDKDIGRKLRPRGVQPLLLAAKNTMPATAAATDVAANQDLIPDSVNRNNGATRGHDPSRTATKTLSKPTPAEPELRAPFSEFERSFVLSNSRNVLNGQCYICNGGGPMCEDTNAMGPCRHDDRPSFHPLCYRVLKFNNVCVSYDKPEEELVSRTSRQHALRNITSWLDYGLSADEIVRDDFSSLRKALKCCEPGCRNGWKLGIRQERGTKVCVSAVSLALEHQLFLFKENKYKVICQTCKADNYNDEDFLSDEELRELARNDNEILNCPDSDPEDTCNITDEDPNATAARACQRRVASVPDYDSRLSAAQKDLGFQSLRAGQEDAVYSAMCDKDIMIVWPTGHGKTGAYLLPFLMDTREDAVLLVIIPLRSLIDATAKMINKFSSLRSKVFVFPLKGEGKNEDHGKLTNGDYFGVINENKHKKKWIILSTPEQASSPFNLSHFVNYRDSGRLNRIVFDEAHTLCEWSHFRSSMDQLKSLAKLYLKNCPVTALTAAPLYGKALDDVKDKVGFRNPKIVKQLVKDSRRDNNIEIIVWSSCHTNFSNGTTKEYDKKRGELIRQVGLFIEKANRRDEQEGAEDDHKAVSGLIYCSTKDTCIKLTEELQRFFEHNKMTMSVDYFFGLGDKGGVRGNANSDMTTQRQEKVSRDWMKNKLNIIVTTCAFSLGIHKDDVSFVVHWDLPTNLVQYMQEIGRAGRNKDVCEGQCLLLYDSSGTSRTKALKRISDDQQQEKQKTDLSNVVRFCENFTQCRHVLLGKLLDDQKCSLARCETRCDVCYPTEDRDTNFVLDAEKALRYREAIMSIAMAASFQEPQMDLTCKQLLNAITHGKDSEKNKKLRELVEDVEQYIGIAPECDKYAIERIIVDLIYNRELLIEEVKKAAAGEHAKSYSHVYVKVSMSHPEILPIVRDYAEKRTFLLSKELEDSFKKEVKYYNDFRNDTESDVCRECKQAGTLYICEARINNSREICGACFHLECLPAKFRKEAKKLDKWTSGCPHCQKSNDNRNEPATEIEQQRQENMRKNREEFDRLLGQPSGGDAAFSDDGKDEDVTDDHDDDEGEDNDEEEEDDDEEDDEEDEDDDDDEDAVKDDSHNSSIEIFEDDSDDDEEMTREDDDEVDDSIPRPAIPLLPLHGNLSCFKNASRSLGFKKSWVLHSILLNIFNESVAEAVVTYLIDDIGLDSLINVDANNMNATRTCIQEGIKKMLNQKEHLKSKLDERSVDETVDAPSALTIALTRGKEKLFWGRVCEDKWPDDGFVQLSARLERITKNGRDVSTRLQLGTPAKAHKSCRATRRWGADRFLRVKVMHPRRVSYTVQRLIQKPLHAAGRVWEFVYAKPLDSTLIFFAVSGVGLDEEASLEDFMKWAIPYTENNAKLESSKFVSRFDMVFSDTESGPLPASHVLEIPDDEIESRTDGAGFLIESFARETQWHIEVANRDEDNRMTFRKVLASVWQGRWAGVKGTWTIIPDDKWEDVLSRALGPSGADKDFSRYKMAYRKSQKKFEVDAAHHDSYTQSLEILNRVRAAKHGNAGKNVIPLLEERGVPADLFVELASEMAREVEETMMHASQNKEIAMRYKNADQGNGHILSTYLRAGLSLEHPFIQKRKDLVISDELKKLTDEYKIRLSKSAMCVIVPDPFGVLGPGEVYLNSSLPVVDSNAEEEGIVGVVTGSVVLWRYPCHMVSDVQKVDAVDKEELRSFRDTLILNTKDNPGLAKMLSDGDYDGDEAVCCWDERIVSKVGELRYSLDTPPNADSRCRRDIETTTTTAAAKKKRKLGRFELRKAMCLEECERTFSSALANLSEITKTYEGFADKSEQGVNDFHTRQLALLARMAVDAPKHGGVVQMSQDLIDKRKDLMKNGWPNWTDKGKDALRKNLKEKYYISTKAMGKLAAAVCTPGFWRKTAVGVTSVPLSRAREPPFYLSEVFEKRSEYKKDAAKILKITVLD